MAVEQQQPPQQQPQAQQLQSNSSTPYGVLDGLYRELGITAKDAGGTVTISGADPVTPSVHRIGDAAAAALAALGTEVAAVHQERGGAAQDVTVRVESAVRQLMAVFFTRMRGVPVAQLLEDPNLLGNSDFYRAADGRFVYVLFSYPQLRDIACQVLDCPPDRERIAAAVAQWDALRLEEAICERGGTAIAVRTQEEWRRHPQGRLLAEGPLIRIEKLGPSAPEPFRAGGGGLPLAGVRVLDNTHVIAGPIAARITAELGADVLHMSAPSHPDPIGMIVETGIGKRAAFCDLIDPAQAAAFWSTLAGADLYVSNYLNLDSKGFGPQALVERRPGLVVLDFHGWGAEGPWARRGGFDQLASAATGFAAEEGSFDAPRLPPTYLLNDYLAAVLGTAGALEALRRRAREGGSYRVHVDLAKVCMWVQDLGLLPRGQVAELPAPDPSRAGIEQAGAEQVSTEQVSTEQAGAKQPGAEQAGAEQPGTGQASTEQAGAKQSSPELATVHGPFGEVCYLPTQVGYSSLRPRLARTAEPLGASPLAW
ncbi:CoA transferase [Kitasatospora kifunensis]|uniref:Crotonobetainyl-CoA:carnitine CoA-transferase CaiB-like acyl-CoA transferase n=1 Tax=Kitasatospora kifunensis TaxID=58351 RepID=A0A7W7RBM9_KITKI|nr:CoA transferase [Kitasatospora kifunensis]MBB4928969.1 crotonobetainyl-CoA:carnitine CoA-transferase CaiB-like acyl-CoA transferase [Kitasatospora kifunensis]